MFLNFYICVKLNSQPFYIHFYSRVTLSLYSLSSITIAAHFSFFCLFIFLSYILISFISQSLPVSSNPSFYSPDCFPFSSHLFRNTFQYHYSFHFTSYFAVSPLPILFVTLSSLLHTLPVYNKCSNTPSSALPSAFLPLTTFSAHLLLSILRQLSFIMFALLFHPFL